MKLLPDRNGYVIDGVRYPRISTILNVLSKPGLDAWKRKVGYDEADRVLAEASAYGTATHAACERVAAGESVAAVTADLVDQPDDRMARAVETFARCLGKHVRRVLDTERTCWSIHGRYAGTTDLIVELVDGTLAVVDLKTSNSLSETYRLQLRAYQLALAETTQYRCDKRLVIWIPSKQPDVYAVREYVDDRADERAWNALVSLYYWQRTCGDDWRTDKLLIDEQVSARETADV